MRPTDPALLHYRSGGFYCARARQVPGVDPVRDVLLGVAASADEPIAGGRHKVFGRAELAIVPQTSTIASHLPRALGVALGIGRAAKLGVACPWPRDAVAVASFGDASASHSTAVGAINAACHTAYQGIPVPLLLVCEDNGLGISVPTPPGWVAASFGARPGLRYLAADGCDPVAAYDAAARAAGLVRFRRQPAFLHLSMVRFFGHMTAATTSAPAGRADTDGIPNDDAQFWGAFSTNGGTSFTPNLQISAGTSNSHDSGNGIDYGDYTGLSFYGGIAHPAWSDNSDSTGNNPDGALHQLDIYTAAVPAP